MMGDPNSYRQNPSGVSNDCFDSECQILDEESDSTSYELPEFERGAALVDGRFIVLKKIGCGAIAAAYQAVDRCRSNEMVLMKIAESIPQSTNPAIQWLKNQLQLQRRIEGHEHILKVYDLHSDVYHGAELSVLSMPYVSQGSLSRYLASLQNQSDAPLSERLQVFKDCCCGILAGHRLGAFHLRVKPDNFLFVNNTLKAADFMFSDLTGAWNFSRKEMNSLVFDQNPRPEYWSPEHFFVAKNGELDERSDIYGLGILLYQLLHPTGALPFQGTFYELKQSHIETPIAAPPDAPKRLADCLMRCLQKRPAHRYQTVQELLDDLNESESDRRSSSSEQSQEEAEKMEATHQLWKKTLSLNAQKKYSPAHRFCKEVLRRDPNHSGAALLRAEIERLFREASDLYKSIRESYDRLDPKVVMEKLGLANNMYPLHPDFRPLLEIMQRRTQQFDELCRRGKEALDGERYQDAYTAYQEAGEICPRNSKIHLILQHIEQKIEERRQYEMEMEYFMSNPRQIQS